MVNSFFKLLFSFSFIASFAIAQPADSLIYAEGKVLNAATKELVSARITYQSLPYGSRVGTLNNSTYSFPLFDNEKYSIVVEAHGFTTAKYMIDPAEANSSRRVVKDIELTAGGMGNGNKHEVGNVMRLDNLIFEVNKSKINPESYPELDIVVNMMRENPKMVIQLEGHTDYGGDQKKNMKLSKDRVDEVRQYLISKGTQKNRVKTKAFGGSSPLSRDNTPEAHRLNRRVELRVLEN
jgi:outer membrane protein OmpA-like peptidoglycan-associated protein